MNGKQMKAAFFQALEDLPGIFSLFDHLPDLMFFVKNRAGQIVHCSHDFALRMGGQKEEDILGKDAFDLCPDELARQYTDDDQLVMKTGKPLVNHLELNQGPSGIMNWFVTNKVPVYGRNGEIIGVAGVTRSIAEVRGLLQPYEAFNGIIAYIGENYPQRIPIPDLAKRMHLSQSQFDRRFREVFHMSPSHYLVQIRVNEAARLLVETDMRIAKVAQAVGFYDQSSLTRHFRKVMGITPSKYRSQYQTA